MSGRLQIRAGGNFDVKRSVCERYDINYIPRHQGMTKGAI